MVNGTSTYPAAVAVEHTDLMPLGAPINAHKPIVRQGLIISFRMHGGRHNKAHSSI